jgi:hypothetical protein
VIAGVFAEYTDFDCSAYRFAIDGNHYYSISKRHNTAS